MEIELSKMYLDRQNERFTDLSFLSEQDDEEVIFKYLRDYEELDSMIQSIQISGFHKLGERPVVVFENNRYVVLEGNRRICALKALHGMYSLKPQFNEIYLRATTSIDVDVAQSRDSVAAFLASRHIEGLRMWKPEAKRNFFFKHFFDGKSIDDISKMTSQKPNEIKKLLADSIFLEEFKKRSRMAKIQQPSILYDRISKYFEEMKIIQQVSVGQHYSDSRVLFNTNIPDETISNFFIEMGRALYGQDKFIDSRNASTYRQFQTIFQDSTKKEEYPNLFNSYNAIIHDISRLEFQPIQKVFSSVRGRVPSVQEIIYFEPIKDIADVRIIDSERRLISEQDFQSATPSVFKIVVKEHIFDFCITDYVIPKIIIKEDFFKSIKIRNTIDISKSILIYNEYSESINILSPDVTLSSLSPELVVNPQKQIIIKVAGTYGLDIIYCSKVDSTLIATLRINITGIPDTLAAKAPQEIAFFDFRIVNVSDVEKYTLAGNLMYELESAHKAQHHHVFVAALRSLVEVSLNAFFDNVITKAPTTSYFLYASKTGTYNKLLCFSDISYQRAGNIAEHYRFIKPDNLTNPDTIRDYFDAHITEESLKAMLAALNLGAHQSLSHLFIQDIDTIQPTVVALLEYMCVIEAIGFKY